MSIGTVKRVMEQVLITDKHNLWEGDGDVRGTLLLHSC
jgi:hypothetical protein